jgi:hypothetical protein
VRTSDHLTPIRTARADVSPSPLPCSSLPPILRRYRATQSVSKARGCPTSHVVTSTSFVLSATPTSGARTARPARLAVNLFFLRRCQRWRSVFCSSIRSVARMSVRAVSGRARSATRNSTTSSRCVSFSPFHSHVLTLPLSAVLLPHGYLRRLRRRVRRSLFATSPRPLPVHLHQVLERRRRLRRISWRRTLL